MLAPQLVFIPIRVNVVGFLQTLPGAGVFLIGTGFGHFVEFVRGDSRGGSVTDGSTITSSRSAAPPAARPTALASFPSRTGANRTFIVIQS